MSRTLVFACLCAVLLSACNDDSDSSTTIEPAPITPTQVDAQTIFHYQDADLATTFTNVTNAAVITTASSSRVFDARIYTSDGSYLTRHSQLGQNFLTVISPGDWTDA